MPHPACLRRHRRRASSPPPVALRRAEAARRKQALQAGHASALLVLAWGGQTVQAVSCTACTSLVDLVDPAVSRVVLDTRTEHSIQETERRHTAMLHKRIGLALERVIQGSIYNSAPRNRLCESPSPAPSIIACGHGTKRCSDSSSSGF